MCVPNLFFVYANAFCHLLNTRLLIDRLIAVNKISGYRTERIIFRYLDPGVDHYIV